MDLNLDDLIFHYLSGNIIYDKADEELGEKILKVAEQKIKYNNAQNSKGNGNKIRGIWL